jgi:type IV pilus assembly protein PilA
MKKQSGFTLIELLLVLAIIGIISAIAVPAILSQRDRARDLSSVANCKNIMTSFLGIPDAFEEAGKSAIIKDAASFVKEIIGTKADDSLFPNLWNAKNPHAPTTQGYNTGTPSTETSKAGTITQTAAVGAPTGQVQFGIYNGDTDTGVGTMVVSAVLLKKARSGAGTNKVFYSIQDI